MGFREIGFEGVDWIHMAQGKERCRAFVNTVLNFCVPQKARNFFTS
jgi:hypothetical protein